MIWCVLKHKITLSTAQRWLVNVTATYGYVLQWMLWNLFCRKRRGQNRRKIIIYTNNICTYFVIQVATSPCTTEKPEVDYQGAALQHLHKIKKLKTQKQSCICMFSDSSVSFCNITNCVGNMRSVLLSRHTLNNTIHTRMTQERAGQRLQIKPGVYVTE